MKLRALAVVTFGALLLSGSATAQQAGKVHRVGHLQIAPREAQVPLIEAFERGLTERGYFVGRDMLIEYRFADGKPERLDKLADDLVRLKVDGLMVLVGPIALANRGSIISMSAKAKLPATWVDRQNVQDSALMSYGADRVDLFRRAAGCVDRILKGAKPADLPLEQSTRYVLAVNLKTAKALGITIPQTLLLQANHVVE